MTEWKPIGELFDFVKGTLQSSKCTLGKYTFITAAEEWKTHKDFSHDCEALIFAMAASGSLGRTHYIKGKFISSDLCFILTPQKGLRLDLIFYCRLFNFLRTDIVKKTATGTSKLAINQTNFGAYKLPYFDYEHQLIFRDKIEKIKGISECFSHGLDDQLLLFKKLSQQILQEAIEGTLTADWRKKNLNLISGDNHASKLLEKIKAEKERLIKEEKIRKDKPLVPIKPEEVPFELPQGWEWMRLGKILKFDTGSLDSNAAEENGKYPFFTCAKEPLLINKYAFDCKAVLLAGNNAAGKYNVKYYEGKFNAYQRTYVITDYSSNQNSIIYKYIKYLLEYKLEELQEKSLGSLTQYLTLGILKPLFAPIPPLAEQRAIVERVDRFLAVVDDLEKQVTERKSHSEMLMQSVLREAFTE